MSLHRAHEAKPSAKSDHMGMFREVIVSEMHRKGHATADVARQIGIERSYLSKILHGTRPLNMAVLELLVDHLQLDKNRLALAVGVMSEPAFYHDRTFINLSYYTQTMLAAAMSLAEETGESFSYGAIFGSLRRDRCEMLARTAIAELAKRFAELDPFALPGKQAA